jgi:hypothetical protein
MTQGESDGGKGGSDSNKLTDKETKVYVVIIHVNGNSSRKGMDYG